MMQWSGPFKAPAGAQQHPTAPQTGPVVVNVPSWDVLEGDLRTCLTNRQGFCLATLNLDHVDKLRQNPEFAAAYRAHSHVTADGRPIVWLSRLAGHPVSLLPGSDMIHPVATLAAETGTPLALFGSSQEALDGAAEALCAAVPGLQIPCRISPPMGFDPTGEMAESAIETLRGSGAGLCLVALGAPKQEIFAAHAHGKLPHMGFMSIGAGLDFLSGHQKRAPRIVRMLAAEWLWRLLSDPKRLARRYAACFALLPGLLVRALQARRAGQG